MRWVWAVVLVACASAPHRVQAPLRVPRVIEPREAPPAIVTLEEREAIARDEAVQDGAEIVAAHRERIDGEARLHLVLDQGRCYRAWIGVDSPFAARLEDEHGNAIATTDGEGAAWIDRVCPRWTGSFALIVAPGQPAFDLDVLLVTVP